MVKSRVRLESVKWQYSKNIPQPPAKHDGDFVKYDFYI
nr:MAG TPA: hypothetical protein [Bacteriophage sp.]